MEHDYRVFKPALEIMADEARKIALKYFRTELNVTNKDDRTPVTLADQEIEATLRDYIRLEYPEHGVLGEEGTSERLDADYVWIIDPIDGTKPFATGKPLFGTIIGLTHKGRPIAGLIDQAYTRERWVGIKGHRTTYNDVPTNVAVGRDLSAIRLYTSAPEIFDKGYEHRFQKLRKSVQWCLYSADCYAYGMLASGYIDIVVERYLGKHDIFGLIPVIEGSGGYVTNWAGELITLDHFDGTIIAGSTPKTVGQIQAILAQ